MSTAVRPVLISLTTMHLGVDPGSRPGLHGRVPTLPAPPDPLPVRPRLRDVAALAGVSVKTASRVFNAHPSVSPQTAKRVLDAARELRFSPNGLARELRRGGVTSAVGLVVGDLANPFYSQIAAGAERVLREQGLELFLATSDENPEHEERVIRILLERRGPGPLVGAAPPGPAPPEAQPPPRPPAGVLGRPAQR